MGFDKPKGQKFNNIKVKKTLEIKRLVGGVVIMEKAEWQFDSKREYEHFLEFRQDEKEGVPGGRRSGA